MFNKTPAKTLHQPLGVRQKVSCPILKNIIVLNMCILYYLVLLNSILFFTLFVVVWFRMLTLVTVLSGSGPWHTKHSDIENQLLLLMKMSGSFLPDHL